MSKIDRMPRQDPCNPSFFTNPEAFEASIENDIRRARLSELLASGKTVRFMEAHSPISALLVEKIAVRDENAGAVCQFDGFWSSSLTDSTLLGLPDIEILDLSTRINAINQIFEVTRKPLIMDGDTGGQPEHLARHVRTMERAGISAVIIEDKTGLKKNSLFGNDVKQEQDDVQAFCRKIESGKSAQFSPDFMLIARIESLILEKGMTDALMRAREYVSAGADGIMIHSRRSDPLEILEFARRFRDTAPTTTLVCVPTSYNEIHFSVLEEAGFNIVIYANHLLRSSYKTMMEVARDVLRYGRTSEVEDRCLSVNEILNLIPGTR